MNVVTTNPTGDLVSALANRTPKKTSICKSRSERTIATALRNLNVMLCGLSSGCSSDYVDKNQNAREKEIGQQTKVIKTGHDVRSRYPSILDTNSYGNIRSWRSIMPSTNKPKVEDDKRVDEPKIAMSFHRHRLRYYGVIYMLIFFIICVNFDW